MKNKPSKSKNESVQQPFFSVIITTYNRAKLVTRALDSLIAQNEKDWEALIVDDGSTDDTFSLIRHYLEQYSGTKYICKSHSGFVAAKNTGLRSATGKFVTFLDSDDEFDPIHLETRKSILIENPSVKFLYGGVKILGTQYVPDRFNPTRKIDLADCIIGGSFFIERITAMALNGFSNIPLGDDADLFDRAKNAGVTMMEVREPTYIYHHETEDSITNKMLSHK